MTAKTLDAMQISNPSANFATSGTIRYYADQPFTAWDGTQYMAGAVDSLDYFLSTTWSIVGGNLVTAPIAGFPSTDDAIEGNGVRITAAIYNGGPRHEGFLFDSFRIHNSLPSTISLAQLVLANGARQLLRDTAVWTKEQTIDYINTLPPAALGTSLVHGRLRLDVVPANIADPIAVGANSPLINAVVNVKAAPYLATGDGVTDDTAVIQTAATAATGKTLYFPAGTFIVSQILLSSNTRVYLDPLAIVKMKSGEDSKGVFALRDLDNVIIEGGGTIDGNHAGGALRSICVLVQGGSRLRFRDFTVQDADDTGSQRGDGIYLGVAFSDPGLLTNPVPSDVVIDGITATGNARQAISVIGARKLRIVNCTLKDTTGIGEGAGLDMEPNPDGRTVADAVTNGTTTITSATAAFVDADILYSPQVIIIIPTGGTFVANIVSKTNATTIVVDVAPTFSLSGLAMRISRNYSVFQDVVIDNNIITNNAGAGILFTNPNRAPHKAVSFTNNKIRGNGRQGLTATGDMVEGLIISGNEISGTTDDAGTGDGLTLAAANKGARIINNDIFANEGKGLHLSGSLHYEVSNNRINRNGTHGITIRTDTVPGSVGASGLISYNHIFNNGTVTANTYDGISVIERADDNVGVDIAHNWVGNDVSIYYIPTQRYGLNYASSGANTVQNVTALFNNFNGNLTGKIHVSGDSQFNPAVQFGDFVSGTTRSLGLGFGENGAGIALLTTATQGFLTIAGGAGAPTGVPANPAPVNGAIPLYVDVTNGRFYAYYGAAWHFVALT